MSRRLVMWQICCLDGAKEAEVRWLVEHFRVSLQAMMGVHAATGLDAPVHLISHGYLLRVFEATPDVQVAFGLSRGVRALVVAWPVNSKDAKEFLDSVMGDDDFVRINL